MIRGRHRGLPVAIDRAVLLPSEFERYREEEDNTYQPRNGYGASSVGQERLPSSQEKYPSSENGDVSELRQRAAARRRSREDFIVEESRNREAERDNL